MSAPRKGRHGSGTSGVVQLKAVRLLGEVGAAARTDFPRSELVKTHWYELSCTVSPYALFDQVRSSSIKFDEDR